MTYDHGFIERHPYLFLSRGTYLIDFNEKVNLPNDMYAVGMSRSSLLRCGCSIASAVWDPGYHGYGQAKLDVGNPIVIIKNARIFQLQFFRCENTESYDGIYNER